MRRLKARLRLRFPRHKLANDGTRIPAGSAIVTPSMIRGECIAEYRDQESLGWVENVAAFIENLVVERNGDDPTRVDILFPPDLVNGLHIFAVLFQPRLQYAQAA